MIKSEQELLFVSTIALVAVSGISLLFCNYVDKNKEASRYYKDVEPVKYYALEFCYSIVMISFFFNARFLFSTFLMKLKSKLLTR